MQRNMKWLSRWVGVAGMLSCGAVHASVVGGGWQHGMADAPDGRLAAFAVGSTLNEATLWTAVPTSCVQGAALVWLDRPGTSADGRSAVQVHRVALQPGAEGRYALARWQAPADGTYLVEASLLNQQAGPGRDVDVQVILRHRALFDQVLAGGMPEQKLRLTVELQANEAVVFVVGSSEDGGTNDCALLTVGVGAMATGSKSAVQASDVPPGEYLAVTNSCRVCFESFSNGMAGWVVTPPVTGGRVFWNGSAIQADFEELPLPVPENVRIAAGRAASDGRFVGDWASTSIDEVSFDFYAEGCTPSWVQMRIHDGTHYAFKGLAVTSTNVWQHFTVNVEAMEAGGWNGGLTEADFAVLRTNVQEVSLLVMRCGVAAQSFRVDNFTIDRVQRALQWGGGTATPALTWTHLLSNRTYRVETVLNPGDTNWMEVASVTATDSVSSVTLPLTNAFGFMRLVHP